MDEPSEEVNAHALTLEFWRWLTKEEFRTVVDHVRAHVPYVMRLTVNTVHATDEQLAAELIPRNVDALGKDAAK